MSKSAVLSVALLGAVCIMPIHAQKPNEEGTFNFSIGGGLSVPLNPTANYAGVGGGVITGAGYNLNQHNSIVGQFQWAGLPPTILPPLLNAIAQINGFSSRANLYSLTANYKYRNGVGKTFGYYLIAGGGWYQRRASVSKSTFIPTDTVCEPIWGWYGFTCSDGFVNTVGASTGSSSFGVNGGVGLTVRIKNSPWKFFLESRYNYAATRFIATQVAPVTFGFAYQ
jgi:hypothetical protein